MSSLFTKSFKPQTPNPNTCNPPAKPTHQLAQLVVCFEASKQPAKLVVVVMVSNLVTFVDPKTNT
jgi:hypothetical protein